MYTMYSSKRMKHCQKVKTTNHIHSYLVDSLSVHHLLRLLSLAFLWFTLLSFLVKYLNFFTFGFFFCLSSTPKNFAYLVALFMLWVSTFSAFSNLTLFKLAK